MPSILIIMLGEQTPQRFRRDVVDYKCLFDKKIFPYTTLLKFNKLKTIYMTLYDIYDSTDKIKHSVIYTCFGQI